MKTNIIVLVADDQKRARQSLKALLETSAQVGSVREAGNGRAVLESFDEVVPDVVLMDILMPEMDGLQACRLIKERWPQVKVVALSMYDDYRAEAASAGADVFLNKVEAPEKLVTVIEEIS